MRNPIKLAGKGIEKFVNNHPFIALWAGATLAVNAVVYTALAGMEGIERACGVAPYNTNATLQRKDVAYGPQGKIVNYGIFQAEDGREFTLMDFPAITEGKLMPGTLRNMRTNETYNVRVFGSEKFIPRIVDAEPVSQ